MREAENKQDPGRRTALRAAVLLVAASVMLGAGGAAPEKAVRARIAEHYADTGEGPGGIVAVVDASGSRIVAAYGSTGSPEDAPIDEHTPFYVASLAKPFTALAVLTLAERGALDLDHPVTRYVPQLPQSYARVTLSRLLTHQSGVPDYFRLLDDRIPEGFTNGDVRRLIADRPLDHEPGTAVAYSNSGFVLLAEVVQRADGRSLARWLAEEVFRPLGMRDAFVAEPGTAIPDRVARGFVIDEDGTRVRSDPVGRTTGAGGMYASLTDLIRFDRELRAPRVLPKAAIEAMHVPANTADGERTPFGPGWIVGMIERPGPLDGRLVQQTFGDLAGFRAAMRRFDDGVTIVWLANDGRHLFEAGLAEAWYRAED
jgi:CubicO group peptidase (beta-lactamase class C family)